MRTRFLLVFIAVITLLAPSVSAKDLLIPLDDRPANLLFARQLARIGQPQEVLLTPPRNLLGRLFKPGDSEQIAAWAQNKAEKGDHLIICSDMWIYGGLVASRSANTTKVEVEERLKGLSKLKRKGVTLTVIATIPRLSLRTSDKEAAFESSLAAWAAKDGLPTAEEMLDSPDSSPLPSNIPREITLEYLKVRARNTSTLLTLIDMCARGEIDSLVLGQDDAHKTGIHLEEQARLGERIKVNRAENRVTILSGIDELTMNVISRHLAHKSKHYPSVRVIYSQPEAAEKVPPMESITLGQMVKDHLILSGARELNSENSDVDLFIYTPSDKPYVIPGEDRRPASLQFVEKVKQAMKSGRRVAVADLSLINRADPFLAQAMLSELKLPQLQAFASWNTPANAVGTAIAQLVCHRIAENSKWDLKDRLESEKTQQAFLLARMIDDYGYQTLVREEVKPQASGLSSTANPLLNEFGPVGLKIRLLLIDFAQKLFNEHYKDKTICLLPQKSELKFEKYRLEVVLPWPRIFEVEARLDLHLIPTKNSCSTASETGTPQLP